VQGSNSTHISGSEQFHEESIDSKVKWALLIFKVWKNRDIGFVLFVGNLLCALSKIFHVKGGNLEYISQMWNIIRLFWSWNFKQTEKNLIIHCLIWLIKQSELFISLCMIIRSNCNCNFSVKICFISMFFFSNCNVSFFYFLRYVRLIYCFIFVLLLFVLLFAYAAWQ